VSAVQFRPKPPFFKVQATFFMTETSLLKYLQDNPFLLAPMAGITDCAFRSFMREMGCGAIITELVSANGLHYESARTRQIMKFEESQRPVGIQLFGEHIGHLAEAAKLTEDLGADFVDLNFGCPVPKVVNKGAGSGVLRDLNHLSRILAAVKRAVSIPVTIKIRTGWDEKSRNSAEVVRLASEEGITWVTIHGRTRAAGYSGKADWEYISDVKKTSSLPVIGNGDLTSASAAVERLRSSRCDAVMIGRGCLKNPWIFREATALFRGESQPIDRDFDLVFHNLCIHLESHFPERIVLLQLKKLAAWFSTGYPDASRFRRDLFSSKEKVELKDRIRLYFDSVKQLVQADTGEEAFLMGGHG
jgi:nifR3 family TIM-barrel protein